VALGLEFAVKYSLQFVIATISIASFFQSDRFTHEYNTVCEGAKHKDKLLADIGTALFWVTALPIFHLSLKG